MILFARILCVLFALVAVAAYLATLGMILSTRGPSLRMLVQFDTLIVSFFAFMLTFVWNLELALRKV